MLLNINLTKRNQELRTKLEEAETELAMLQGNINEEDEERERLKKGRDEATDDVEKKEKEIRALDNKAKAKNLLVSQINHDFKSQTNDFDCVRRERDALWRERDRLRGERY